MSLLFIKATEKLLTLVSQKDSGTQPSDEGGDDEVAQAGGVSPPLISRQQGSVDGRLPCVRTCHGAGPWNTWGAPAGDALREVSRGWAGLSQTDVCKSERWASPLAGGSHKPCWEGTLQSLREEDQWKEVPEKTRMWGIPERRGPRSEAPRSPGVTMGGHEGTLS